MAVEIRGRVDALRLELEAAKAERDSVARLPQTPEETTAAVDRWIADTAARWQPPIGSFAAPSDDGRLPCFSLMLPIPDGAGGVVSVESQAESLLCVLFGDRVRVVLLERCEENLARFGSGLPAGERRAKLEQLDARILQLERREEDLIDSAEAEGIEIDRRADANVWVVFGIKVEEAGEAPPASRARRTRSSVQAPDSGDPLEAA